MRFRVQEHPLNKSLHVRRNEKEPIHRQVPALRVYRVMWEGPGNYQGNYRHAVLYERRDNRIGYEDDFLSSFSGETYVVDGAAIHAVADEGQEAIG